MSRPGSPAKQPSESGQSDRSAVPSEASTSVVSRASSGSASTTGSAARFAAGLSFGALSGLSPICLLVSSIAVSAGSDPHSKSSRRRRVNAQRITIPTRASRTSGRRIASSEYGGKSGRSQKEFNGISSSSRMAEVRSVAMMPSTTRINLRTVPSARRVTWTCFNRIASGKWGSSRKTRLLTC